MLNRERTVSSINSIGKTEQPLAKDEMELPYTIHKKYLKMD